MYQSKTHPKIVQVQIYGVDKILFVISNKILEKKTKDEKIKTKEEKNKKEAVIQRRKKLEKIEKRISSTLLCSLCIAKQESSHT
jgi:hypothetical protein